MSLNTENQVGEIISEGNEGEITVCAVTMQTDTVFDTRCRVCVESQDESPVDARVLIGRGQLVVATDDGGETIPVNRVFDVSTAREYDDRRRLTVGYESSGDRRTISLVAAGETATALRRAVFVAVVGGTWVSVRSQTSASKANGEAPTVRGRLRVDDKQLRIVDDDTVVCVLRDVERIKTTDAPERMRVQLRRDGARETYELSLPSARIRNVVARYLRTACGVGGATVGAAPNDGLRVLLVDDDVGFATLASDFISHEHDNVELETVTDPAAGLERLRETPPIDCVVSDYRMPPTNGIEFLKRVRELDPDLPFLLFTGRGDEEIAAEAIRAGVTDYIRKKGTAAQFAFLVDRISQSVGVDTD